MVIPFLPLILQAKFGDRAWPWFKQSASYDLEGMYWDTDTHQVWSYDEQTIQDVLTDWGEVENLGDIDVNNDETMKFNIEIQLNLAAEADDF